MQISQKLINNFCLYFFLFALTFFLVSVAAAFILNPPQEVERAAAVSMRYVQESSSGVRWPSPRSVQSSKSDSVQLVGEELYRSYVHDICKGYAGVNPYMIEAIIYYESRFVPSAKNATGTCVGLMQLSTKWHTSRAAQLGVSDLYDPYGNILTGVDYFAELLDKCIDPAYALMSYNMGQGTAKRLYNKGVVSSYAANILAMAEELEKGARVEWPLVESPEPQKGVKTS